ncbi:MAG TPA: hypothetical protein VFZ62_00635 [Candidatus Saccharimonadales bacterium]
MSASTRKSRRWPLVVFGAVTALVLSVVGLQSIGSSGEPATPAPAREVALPGTNTGWQGSSELTALFNRLTFQRPSGEIWDSGDSAPKGTQPYTDISGCTSNCTVITFVDLADPEMGKFFGDNPAAAWAKDSCTQEIHGELSGSKEFDLSGQTARYYYLPCGPEDEYSGHAWYIPGKKLFVMTYAGDGGPMSPEILRSVMDTVRWV